MKRISPGCVLAAFVLLGLSARAQQNAAELNVAIRSGVDDAEQKQRDHDPAYAQDQARRTRLFFLGSVRQARSVEKLVRPVNALAMAQELTRQLEARGFRAAEKDQLPEIVITVEYGRGYLPNPYRNNLGDKAVTNLSNSDVVAPWASYASYHRLEEKAQSAAEEKLVIQVRAWKCPTVPDSKKKPTMLWMTTMHVDDPDHRDLNQIFPHMLARGAAYFDRHIARESEVIVPTTLPEGRVKVGTPEEVVDPRAK